MKFYDDMPDIEANDDLILMVGNPLDSNAPRKTTLAKIKAFIRTNWSIAFGDLGDKPKINGVDLKGGDNTLSELNIQPKGNYVIAATGERLITDEEATKIASAITSNDLEPYSLKDTGDLEEAVEVPKEEKQYIKFFDEVNGIEKKISLPNFIIGVSTPIYPTARALLGEKNGSNEIFTSEYNYIAGSEKLNINGSVYYPNSGFYKEGNNIILSGAPIPEAGDFMFLEAVYLD